MSSRCTSTEFLYVINKSQALVTEHNPFEQFFTNSTDSFSSNNYNPTETPKKGLPSVLSFSLSMVIITMVTIQTVPCLREYSIILSSVPLTHYSIQGWPKAMNFTIAQEKLLIMHLRKIISL